ncbi:MAG: 50S ribosomal protein L11 methyltransferase, partial [Ectothiorhodospiraceae bacterium]|nr:50S ribosomal protein L11 methyltransferase [Ectothiorhodospiraceae bacterium]
SATLGAEEIQAAMDYPAYWAFCWASGQVQARNVLDHPELVRGRTVLDFGCGSGVAGIAAALAGAARVIACDLDPDALVAARENARLNGVELQMVSDFWQGGAEAELILAADILYDRANMDWPSRFLRHAEAALLADSRIRNFREPGYRKVASRLGCTWPDLDEMDEFRKVNIYLGFT